MSDVKWIKISTDVFNDEKILLIESLPKADSILVVWFQLLCLAGKTNNGGKFLLSDSIPYTNEMLSKIFRRKKSVVDLAIKTFQEFGMVEIVDGVITISNWEKHQSLQGIKSRNEYMKEYMKNRRSKQIVNVNKVNSKHDVNTGEEEKEKEEDKELINIKHIYGEYKHVKLTDKERDKLFNDFGEEETLEAITFLDEYIQMKGYKAKDHNLALRKWVFKAVNEQKAKSQPKQQSVFDAWANA